MNPQSAPFVPTADPPAMSVDQLRSLVQQMGNPRNYPNLPLPCAPPPDPRPAPLPALLASSNPPPRLPLSRSPPPKPPRPSPSHQPVPAPEPATNLPPALPVTFAGERTRALAFINLLEHSVQYHYDAFFANPSLAVSWASAHLSGPAAAWFQKLRATSPEALSSWKAFRSAFADAYIPPSGRLLLLEQLLELRQTTTVQEYNRSFSRLMGQLDMTEDSGIVKDIYLRGLKRDIYVKLEAELEERGRPVSVGELAKLAYALDRAHGHLPSIDMRNPSSSSSQPVAAPTPSFPNTSSSNPYPTPTLSPSSLNTSASDPKPRTHSQVPPKPIIQPILQDLPPPPADIGQPRQQYRLQIRDYRRKHNLCAYCGMGDHYLEECPDRADRTSEQGGKKSKDWRRANGGKGDGEFRGNDKGWAEDNEGKVDAPSSVEQSQGRI